MHKYIHTNSGDTDQTLRMGRSTHIYIHTYIHTYIPIQVTQIRRYAWDAAHIYTYIHTYIHTYQFR